MRIFKKLLVFLVITLTLSVSIAQAESDSKEEIISPFIAQETANALIHKICNYAQLEGEGVGITWKQIQAGTPVLVYDPDYVPKYFIVPGINTSTGEVVTRIGVDAKTGEWQWYVEKCLIKTFPPVSEQQAKNIALDFMQKQRMTGKIEEPYCVEMPNKKLYWAFQVSGGDQITYIYVNFENASEIFTNLDKEELRLNMPSFNPVNGSVVQPLLSIKEERHGGQALPASHDIAMPHYYQEKSWYCGEACLQMVFDYYGPKISQDDIGDVANENPSYGTYASDLRRAAHFSDLSTAIQNPALRGYKERALGYGAFERTSSTSWLSGLKQVIASDHPVIVLGWYSAAHTSGHFRVVKGYDDNLGEIITHDPWYGPPFQGPNQHFSYAYFNDLWSRNNYLGIMVSPWNVSVKCPPTVAPNTMFTVEATVEYVYNNNFFSQYTASNSQAQIHLPPGYSLAPGETQTKSIDVTVPGSSDTVSWRVVAPATLSDGDTITISAFGYITGSSHSYVSYTDRIGGEGVAVVSVVPISPIDKGLLWLRDQQNPDGSWTYSGRVTEENVGLTAMATLAFLNHGIDENDPTVRKAIDWILSKQQADGKITNRGYHNYDTSLAVLALVATRNESYYDEIKKAVSFLIKLQNDEDEGYTQDSPYYGGWPYWKWMWDWADLSNSQFTMLALHYAEQFNLDDDIVPEEVWDKAEIFVTRCQNREASNPDYNFYDDGGFIYQPGSTIWAGGRSYASMTTAGLWGLYTCGVSGTDGRVQDVWNWIKNNYYVNQNYPLGEKFLYYYLYGLAKACMLWNVETINGHIWYSEMVDELINRQQEDGHWPGTDWSEEPDNVATCWALLALESKLVPTGTGIEIRVDSPADLHVYDPEGRHVGINYDTGEVEIEIPGATYSGPSSEPQVIHIPDPIGGSYKIKLVGIETGDYTLTIKGFIGENEISTVSYTGSINPGQVYESTAIVSAIAGALTIDTTEPELIVIQGDFDNDGDVDQNDLNLLLTYRNQSASACPECDIDGDGVITVLDARKLVLMCTRPRCATEPE